VHFDLSATAHILHLSTVEVQQICLSELKNPELHLVQTVLSVLEQSLQSATVALQQASFAMLRYPTAHPVHALGAASEHLLQSVTEKEQQASLSTLVVKPVAQTVHLDGSAEEQSLQFATRQQAFLFGLRVPLEHPVQVSRSNLTQLLQLATDEVQQSVLGILRNFPVRQAVHTLASRAVHLLQSGTGVSQQLAPSTLRNLVRKPVRTHSVQMFGVAARQLRQFWTVQQAEASRLREP
jgi:hypothetical protein